MWSVAGSHAHTFTGSADHLVSKAFYFTDPEGNGVELYHDRDRSQWSWTHGMVEIATLFLDPDAFLREHLDEKAVEQASQRPASVGHVHLCVGDIDSARRFYVDQLGFETTGRLGSHALFVSAGGYHHHMAMNTWTSAGAGRRRATLGLGLVRIELPQADDLAALSERLAHHHLATADDGVNAQFRRSLVKPCRGVAETLSSPVRVRRDSTCKRKGVPAVCTTPDGACPLVHREVG